MYEYFSERVGKRLDVVEGEFVENEGGHLIVSVTPLKNSIYINKFNKTWASMSEDFIGRPYILGKSDCAILCAKYLDKHVNSSIEKVLLNLTMKEWANYTRLGVDNIIRDVGGVEIDREELSINDVVSYKLLDSDTESHLGVYIGENRILQHLPKKFSGIDPIDYSRVTRVFRYGN